MVLSALDLEVLSKHRWLLCTVGMQIQCCRRYEAAPERKQYPHVKFPSLRTWSITYSTLRCKDFFFFYINSFLRELIILLAWKTVAVAVKSLLKKPSGDLNVLSSISQAKSWVCGHTVTWCFFWRKEISWACYKLISNLILKLKLPRLPRPMIFFGWDSEMYLCLKLQELSIGETDMKACP